MSDEKPLAGYFNEETGISAVECLLPLHYKNSNTLSVHIIETRVAGILVFYYLFSNKESDFNEISFALLPSYNDEVTNKPNPLDSLTWKWYNSTTLIYVKTFVPLLNWGPFICDKIAQGVCQGMLSLDFTHKEQTQKQWETVINNTVDHLTGLNHGGKEN